MDGMDDASLRYSTAAGCSHLSFLLLHWSLIQLKSIIRSVNQSLLANSFQASIIHFGLKFLVYFRHSLKFISSNLNEMKFGSANEIRLANSGQFE